MGGWGDGGIFWVAGGVLTFFMVGQWWVGYILGGWEWVSNFYGWWVVGDIFWVGGVGRTFFMGGW